MHLNTKCQLSSRDELTYSTLLESFSGLFVAGLVIVTGYATIHMEREINYIQTGEFRCVGVREWAWMQARQSLLCRRFCIHQQSFKIPETLVEDERRDSSCFGNHAHGVGTRCSVPITFSVRSGQYASPGAIRLCRCSVFSNLTPLRQSASRERVNGERQFRF